MPIVEQTAMVRGRSTRYLESGAGRPLLLIHGFPLSADMWTPQLVAPPAGWRLIAPDLRGFRGGGSRGVRLQAHVGDNPGVQPDPAEPLTMDDYAGDLIDLLDHLSIREAVIAGLSMGGYVAFALLRRAPRYIAGLVLADTRPQADTEEGRRARLVMQDLLDREGAGGVAREMLPKLLGETTRREHPEIARQVRVLIEVNSPLALRAAVGAMLARPDSTPVLGALRVPTLVVAGAEDTITPVAESERMRQLIPGARLATIPGAGHLSNLEHPSAFNAALARFLDEKV